MLIEFNVTNFRSFRNLATFSMKAAPDDTLAETNLIEFGKQRLIRSAVLYGANASGKSNLLKAIAFMKRTILSSSKETQANEKMNVTPYLLSTECENRPSRFEIEFICKDTQYRYGFEVDQLKVYSEWLFSRPTAKEARLFVREEDKISVNDNRFQEGKGLEERTRSNALFLSVCAQFNGKIATDILGWFQDLNIMYGYETARLRGTTIEKIKDPLLQKQVLSITQIADPSIIGFDLTEKQFNLADTSSDIPERIRSRLIQSFMRNTPQLIQLKTKHRKVDQTDEHNETVSFDFHETASDGTKKLTNMTGPLLDILTTGKVLIVDELDARLHPMLTRLIVTLFNSLANKTNAQLIFTTHDTTLLTPELFRRDQVWFTEKDQFDATDLYSLIELKGVRKETSFSKDYILGKYGAIPFIGDINYLLSSEETDE